ncbi:MAG: 50S ribosomal protein L23 [Candidatus Aenigmarchaeota archaeon]|nr:50S ribosomal protein L23 [Candidatus Aenigmarchaeota archaeon]
MADEKQTTEKKKKEKDVNVGGVVKNDKKESRKSKETKSPKKETKKQPAKKEKKQKRGSKFIVDKATDPFETIQFVLMTEKCVRLIEAQNKLVFVVRRQARKKQIKKAVENAFQSPVADVTTMIDQKGRKRAFVRFAQSGAAGDIAVRLGII